MRLQRCTNRYDKIDREENEFRPTDDGKTVHVRFAHFGKGGEKDSAFVTFYDWSDVESLIRAFADMGRPEAIRVRCAKRLAIAIEELIRAS